jgi:hypothetical protein
MLILRPDKTLQKTSKWQDISAIHHAKLNYEQLDLYLRFLGFHA